MSAEQPVILSIDTATPSSSVALTEGTRVDGKVLASLVLGGSVTHSRRLLKAIDWLMEMADVKWSTIDALTVSLGPGSFTGLRIGMATAKGLAAGADKPLCGVSTLEGLAAKCTTSKLICALLDARKNEVYAGFFRVSESCRLECVGEMTVVKPELLAAQIDEPVLLVGDGAVTYKKLLSEALGDNYFPAPSMLHEPSAVSLGMLGAERLLAGEPLDLASCVPLYIRSSDAELNLQKAKNRK